MGQMSEAACEQTVASGSILKTKRIKKNGKRMGECLSEGNESRNVKCVLM